MLLFKNTAMGFEAWKTCSCIGFVVFVFIFVAAAGVANVTVVVVVVVVVVLLESTMDLC